MLMATKRRKTEDDEDMEAPRSKIVPRTGTATGVDDVSQDSTAPSREEEEAECLVPLRPSRPLEEQSTEHFLSLIKKQIEDIKNDDSPQKVSIQTYIGACLRTAAKKDLKDLMIRLLDEYSPDANIADAKGRTSFMKACMFGKHQIVQFCIKDPRFDVHHRDLKDNHALHLAVAAGQAVITFTLLQPQVKTDVNIQNKTGLSPLMVACQEGVSQALVDVLLSQKNINVDHQDKAGDTSLHIAASKGREDLVRKLLQHRADVNKHNSNGDTALMIAANEGFAPVVKALLEDRNLQINAQNVDGYSALICTADKGHQDIMKMMLDHPRINVNLEDKSGDNALMWAVDKWNLDIVRMLVAREDLEASKMNKERIVFALTGRRGSNTEESWLDAIFQALKTNKPVEALFLMKNSVFTDKSKLNQVFLYSIQEGYKDVVEHMLDTGKVDLRSVEEREVPLIRAVSCSKPGSVEVVKTLLENNVDVRATDPKDSTALMLACDERRHDIVEVLLNHPGIDVNHVSKEDNYTALLIAAGNQDIKTLELLLAAESIDVNKTGFDGKTALIWVSEKGHVDSMSILLQHPKININVQDKHGYTSLMWAADMQHFPAVVELLKRPEVDVKLKDVDGHTALTWACDKGQEDIVRALLKREEIDVNVMSQGMTPLICATKNQENPPAPVVKLLVKDKRTDVNITVKIES